MENTFRPEHILLKTDGVYQLFYLKTIEILKNEDDIREIFNQAIDIITEDIVNNEYSNPLNSRHLNKDMLRCRTLNEVTLKFLNVLFEKLCVELKSILLELNVTPILDVTNLREIYPYYFYKVVRGKVILKRF